MVVVLAPVGQHLAFAQRLLHARDDMVGMLPLEPLCEAMCKGFGFFVGRRAVERNEELEALGAGSLRKRLQSKAVQKRSQPDPNLTTEYDIGRLARIEIERESSGPAYCGRPV